MNVECKNILLLSAAFLLLFACAEILYLRFKVKAEYTRKIVHVGTGLLTLLFPILLSNHWSVLFLCGTFLLILIFSRKYNFLKGINAIDRISYGSLAYPIIVFICYLVWESVEKPLEGNATTYAFFYLPILIMAFADPAAALVGKAFPVVVFKFNHEKKSLSGSSTFFCVAFIISLIFLNASYDLTSINLFAFAVILAVASTCTEVFSRNGWDNLTIPLVVLIVMYILIILL